MPRSRILSAQAVPGGNLGEAFTASIATRVVQPQVNEAYWDSIVIGYKGVIAAASTVVMELFLQLVQPFTFVADTTVINIFGRDAFALANAFYGYTPPMYEGSSATIDKVFGIRIPLWLKTKAGVSYSWFATRVAQTNISSEVLNVTLLHRSVVPSSASGYGTGYQGTGRIDARAIPFTTPAATGITQVTPKLPKLGKLLGLLVFCTTVPTNAADTSDVQNLFLTTPAIPLVSATWADLHATFDEVIDETRADATAMTLRQVLQNYGFLDLRDDPIDLIKDDIALSVDAEVVSEAVRFVPVIEVPQT